MRVFTRSLGFEPSHAHNTCELFLTAPLINTLTYLLRQGTLVVEGGFGHGTPHAYLQCMDRHGPLHDHGCSKCVAGLVWGWGGKSATERIEYHCHNAGSKKSGGRKNLPLVRTLWRFLDYLYLVKYCPSDGYSLKYWCSGMPPGNRSG